MKHTSFSVGKVPGGVTAEESRNTKHTGTETFTDLLRKWRRCEYIHQAIQARYHYLREQEQERGMEQRTATEKDEGDQSKQGMRQEQ